MEINFHRSNGNMKPVYYNGYDNQWCMIPTFLELEEENIGWYNKNHNDIIRYVTFFNDKEKHRMYLFELGGNHNYREIDTISAKKAFEEFVDKYFKCTEDVFRLYNCLDKNKKTEV